jgi:hypothetical protein
VVKKSALLVSVRRVARPYRSILPNLLPVFTAINLCPPTHIEQVGCCAHTITA